MELIERIDLSKINFLNQMDFKEFKKYCNVNIKNEEERKLKFNMMKSYCASLIKSRGEMRRLYSYSLDTVMDMGGRLYCGNSIQGLQCDFRGLLMTHTTDIDMKNAHPVILRYICKIHNIPCPHLEYYVNNRETILSDFPDRNEGKTAFLKALNDNKLNAKIKNNVFKSFDKEMKTLQDKIPSLPDYQSIKDSVPEDKQYNRLGSALNRVLCMYENKILQSCVSAINQKGTEISALMFDGLMIYGNYYNDAELLTYIDDYVNSQFPELNMKWDYKPHSNKIILSDYYIAYCNNQKQLDEEAIEQQIQESKTHSHTFPTGKTIECDYFHLNEYLLNGVNNDLEAVEKIYKIYPHWVYCKGELFVFDFNSGMWVNDKTSYINIIKLHTEYLHTMYVDKNNKLVRNGTNSYGSSSSLMEKMIPLLKTMNMNDDWLKQKQSSSLGKILFHNGYYDYKKCKFYSKEEFGFNPDILFMGRIHHSFEEFNSEDMDYMDDIKHRLFYLALGEEVGNYLLLNLSKGLAGDTMKRILFGLGVTNCGKSVLTSAMMLSCGDYVGSFNAENLAYNKSTSDEAQQMRWCLLLRFKRLIFSNEMKANIELNGNFIKKISSGGDTLIGRQHCKAEEEFIPHFLPIVFANDMMKITPYDDAVSTRVRCISYKKEFCDEPTNAFQLQMDSNLKDELKTLRFQKVFVGLLIKTYMEYSNGLLTEAEPLEVMNSKTEWISQDKSPIDTFLNDYELTNDTADFVTSKSIEEWILSNKLGISMTKFGMEMNKYASIKKLENIKSKQKKIKGKPLMCWFGIKKIQEEEQEPEY
jgi:hypothetical protein